MGAHTSVYFRTEKKMGHSKYCDMLFFTDVKYFGIISNERNAKNTAFKGELFVKWETINSSKLCTPVKGV